MSEGEVALRFDHVGRHYGDLRAVDDVSLAIPNGQFVALVGASGSGKSTLLKTVNRLTVPDTGRVLIHGEDAADLPVAALRRRIGYVFQGIGLFPHMSVAENIAIGPRLSGERLGEARISELLALVELDTAMARRMPDALSGGQTVMVTHDMAEALLLAERVLVMDRGRIVADETPLALLEGAGGSIAQGLVAVPREQARRLAALSGAGPA